MNSGIPGLYSYNGYYQFFLKNQNPKLVGELADESWILGRTSSCSSDPADLQQVADGVCRLYLSDFQKQWALADVTIKPLTTPNAALEILQVLSARPIRRCGKLFETVAHETALNQPPPAPPPDAASRRRTNRSPRRSPAFSALPHLPPFLPCNPVALTSGLTALMSCIAVR